ncbi:MAG: hypothetical protein IPN32_30560 [Deltaproteobacteria bacterium]|nr:hypothetical protein [Deltaproteobacteria bacterium]
MGGSMDARSRAAASRIASCSMPSVASTRACSDGSELAAVSTSIASRYEAWMRTSSASWSSRAMMLGAASRTSS